MEALKGLISTRFGLLLAAIWLIAKIAEANPAIAEICVYTIGILAMSHIVSRTITGGTANHEKEPDSSGDDA